MNASNQSQRAFATTRWSTITQVVDTGEHASREAMGELCLRFRYPVYAYVRRCGHAPAIALDITRSFLDHEQRHFRAAQPPANGYFRSFLLTRLHAYLVEDWRTTHEEGALASEAPLDDLESRYLRDSAHVDSPGHAFQRAFAMEVLARAFARLRVEAQQTGHVDMYEVLAPFIAHDPRPAEYDEVARRLRTRPLALTIALKRLRQRVRELTSEELADTVSSAEELEAEQQALLAVLQPED